MPSVMYWIVYALGESYLGYALSILFVIVTHPQLALLLARMCMERLKVWVANWFKLGMFVFFGSE